MTPVTTAVRAGLRRGLIELRQTMSTAQDVVNFLLPAAVFLVVMLFLRQVPVKDAPISVGAMSLPSMLGLNVAFGGLLAMAQTLTAEREDGTLLRAKAVPNGMLGYLIGKIVTISGSTVAAVLVLLVPGVLLFEGIGLTSLGAWLTLAWVLVLGLVATMPLGAVLGSLFTSPRSAALVMLPIMGLSVISGIFYPITVLPQWVQLVAQCSPIYWLGLGMRSAMLPDSAVVAEIAHSWRPLETFGVLAVWAVLGLVLAPVVLRRMARRESGSSVAARREKAMQRIG
ncbi:ABC transporter permease [Kutzneria viridogrisea]|uniref:ABC-2 type transporter n=2 Tax=Kutzneria TaxID=43356 RepID=W5W3S0_9PSEU|nr:ABC transporter permease [Kutzneria albida]AHH95487.1 ABC-2 type transporter [Kutzneria albida DSM 43870]MBA8927154.1 ABC-2 type transport system permease protein [Kutzneria viridogrisea]